MSSYLPTIISMGLDLSGTVTEIILDKNIFVTMVTLVNDVFHSFVVNSIIFRNYVVRDGVKDDFSFYLVMN